MGNLAYLFPFQPIRIQTCKHIVNILYRKSYAGVPPPPQYSMKMCLPMFTFRIGIGISFEQACQDPHGDAGLRSHQNPQASSSLRHLMTSHTLGPEPTLPCFVP